jgi:outer membrane protein assembly factor BamB
MRRTLGLLLCGLACSAAPHREAPPTEPGDDPAPDAATPSMQRPADAAAPAPERDAGALLTADTAAPPTDVATAPATDAAPVSTGPVSHRFLKGFSGGGSVAIVARSGEIEWEIPVAEHEANDAWLEANGNVLFGFKSGCREVNPAKQTVWEFKSAAGAETHSCQPLPDGNILVGESRSDGTSRLYEMNRQKETLKTIVVQSGGGGSHNQFREVRKTLEGTYLVSQQSGSGKARELDAEGKVLRTFPCGQFVAIRLPGGNTLLACGDQHRVVEVDPQDQVVWEVKENDIPGNRLGFVAGLQRLANGNTVICNWSGHSGLDSQPQVFELTPDKKLVWQVKNPKLNKISTIQILDPEAQVDGRSLR